MANYPFIVRASAVIVAGGILAGLTACATDPVTTASGPISADCQTLFAITSIAAGPKVVVVQDATMSTALPALGAAADTLISAASKSNGTVSVLTVEGSGAPPLWVGKDLPLNNSALPDDTDVHQRIAGLAPTCVRELASTAVPASAGSDILGGMQLGAAALAGHGDLLVATDGIANSGLLDFAKQRFGVKPAEIVAALSSLGQLPRFKGVRVVISGVGAVAGAALNQTIVDWMVSVYQAICDASGAASCTVTPGTAGKQALRGNIPADAAVPFPVLEAPRVDGAACIYTIGNAVLFGGDSAVLDPAADGELLGFIARLPGKGAHVLVTGHTTTFGDVGQNQTLSEARASAVMRRLIELGLDPTLLTSQGKGGTMPRVTPDIGATGVIEAAAAQNRRVELTVTGLTDCS